MKNIMVLIIAIVLGIILRTITPFAALVSIPEVIDVIIISTFLIVSYNTLFKSTD